LRKCLGVEGRVLGIREVWELREEPESLFLVVAIKRSDHGGWPVGETPVVAARRGGRGLIAC
jgi:hypothetical protein